MKLIEATSKSDIEPEVLETLRILPLIAIINKEIDMSHIPPYTIEGNNITTGNDVSHKEFKSISKEFLKKYKQIFKTGNLLVQQKFNNLIISQGRLDTDSIQKVDLKLGSEVLKKVISCERGAKICGLNTDLDKILFAQLLQNSIPSLFYLYSSDFVELRLQDNAFSGVLVLIDDNKGTDFDLIPKTTSAKIISLVNKEPDEYDLIQTPPQLQHLDLESQEIIRRLMLNFMRNKMEAAELFGPHIEKYTINEILSLKSNIAAEVRDESFHFEQRLCSEDKENGWNGTVDEFTNTFQPGESVLLSAAPGLGKSVAMLRITAALRKRFTNYCIIYCNKLATNNAIFKTTISLHDVFKTVVTINQQVSNVHTRENEEMIEKIVMRKLEAKEVIFLIDNIDHMVKKESLKSFISKLKEYGIGVVVAHRNKTNVGPTPNFFALNKIVHLKIIAQNNRCKFVANYCNSTGAQLTEQIIEEMFQKTFEENDDLWGAPLHLTLVAQALKENPHRNIYPFKLLIAGAASYALQNVEKVMSLSTDLQKNVYRLAACEVFTFSGSYTKIQFTENDLKFLRVHPLLTMSEISKTVTFTSRGISEYLVAEALIRVFHQDADVDKQDFNNECIKKVIKDEKYRNVRCFMEKILKSVELVPNLQTCKRRIERHQFVSISPHQRAQIATIQAVGGLPHQHQLQATLGWREPKRQRKSFVCGYGAYK